MSFTSTSNGREPSHHSSRLLSSLASQQPWSLNHEGTLGPNFEDTRFDHPRRSVKPPNSDSFFTSHPQIPRDPNQTVHPSSSHLPFTSRSNSQLLDPGVPGQIQSHVPTGPLFHANSVTDATALCQPSYLPSCPCITHPPMPSAGPSSFDREQPTLLPWNDNTVRLGPVMGAPGPALTLPLSGSLPLQPLSSDPRVFDPFLTAPAQAQVPDISTLNTTSWPHLPGGRTSTSTRVPARPHRPRTRPLRAPLVRVEDRVVWVRPNVLKVTLWLNWSPNADAEAREPWDN